MKGAQRQGQKPTCVEGSQSQALHSAASASSLGCFAFVGAAVHAGELIHQLVLEVETDSSAGMHNMCSRSFYGLACEPRSRKMDRFTQVSVTRYAMHNSFSMAKQTINLVRILGDVPQLRCENLLLSVFANTGCQQKTI